MNAPSIPSASPDIRRRWARQLLDLPAEAGPEGSTADVLQRLQDAEFVPSPSWRQAMQTLVGSPSTPGGGVPSPHAPDSLASHGEEEVRGEVEAFAAQFFMLDPGPRRQRWQELRSRPGLTPALALRLDALAEGLNLDEKSLRGDQADLGELAKFAARCSVLRPRARAQLRRQKLAEWNVDAPRWQRAAARLQRDRPALAALAPDLLRGLKGGMASEKRPAAPRFAPPAAAPASTSAPVPTSGSSKGSTWWIWIVIVALMSLFRGMSSMNSPSRPSYTPPPASYPPPNIQELLRKQPQLYPGSGEGKSPQPFENVLRQFREEERRRKQEGATSPPPTPDFPPSYEIPPDEAIRRLLEAVKKEKTRSSNSSPPPLPSGAPSSRPQ